MIRLEKPITRLVDLGERRPIVVTIEAKDGTPLLSFREKGRRGDPFTIPLARVYALAALKAAELEREQRKERRVARRRAREDR